MIEVLYRDDYIIAVNKPPKLLVHKSRECTDKDNLLKQLRNQIDEYVYPINRLDRAVSGIVIFTTNPEVVRKYQEIWHTDQIRKFYLALSRGLYNSPGEYNFALSDENKVKKEAHTLYDPLVRFKTSTLLEVEIRTGRYHQIRRHFARRVDHLLGDRKYGKKKYNDRYLELYGLSRIFLHAHQFQAKCPFSGEKIAISCPLAPDLVDVLKQMSSEYLETIRQTAYIDHYDG